MSRALTFRNLPFAPVEGQVIYVEPYYDKKLNGFIQNHYEWLRTAFRQEELEFCYLPLLAEEAICYNAPYLSEQNCKDKAKSIPSLTDYLDDESLDCPVLVFGHNWETEDAEGHIVLQSVNIQKKFLTTTKRNFQKLAKEIRQLSFTQRREHREASKRLRTNWYAENEKSKEKRHNSQVRFSIAPKTLDEEEICFCEREEEQKEERSSEVRFSIGGIEDEQHVAEDDFDSESMRLIDEIKTRIESLRNRGVSTMFLHEIIDKGEQISRLRITKDFRVYLVDYGNMEIKMPVLPKSVFMLFLRHPEGIRFKELSDYYSELLEIYLKMNPIGGRQKQEQSIRDVTDPCSNSINEKCARIREAFVANFDDRLAKNYYVTGKRGEPKRIILDKTMILWDN